MRSRTATGQPSFASIAADFLTGALTPREHLERCIEAIERREPVVQAFVCHDFASARAQADAATARYHAGKPLSPVDGMPIAAKDIIDTADLPTQMNSPIYSGHRPRGDAAAVRAAREGGAVVIGKTVTTEFAVGRSGPTTNPHNAAHTPGASSSGSAAGTAAGMFAAAFGTQTVGSIIRPASYCGVVGYKPSFGALSTQGVHPIAPSHDHLGVLAPSVESAWLLARWVAERASQPNAPGLGGPIGGPMPAAKPSRLAVLRTAAWAELDAGSLAAFEGTLLELRNMGVQLVEPEESAGLGALVAGLSDAPEQSLRMVGYEMRWPYLGYARGWPELLGERIHTLLAQADTLPREQYEGLLAGRDSVQRQVAALAGEFDGFVLPSASGPAPVGLEFTGSRTLQIYASYLGLPAYSLPLMEVGGMPFGLQLLGFSRQDHKLSQHAQWLLAMR